MKKRILSVLLCGSLLFGTIFANAVSIGFEDLEQNNDESSIYFEDLEQSDKTSDLEETQIPESENIETVLGNEINVLANETDSYTDEYYFPEATDETIQSLFFDFGTEYNISRQTHTSNKNVAYLTNSENVECYGYARFQGDEVIYTNPSIKDTAYVVYSNAVILGDKKYDFVIYPFQHTGFAYLSYKQRDDYFYLHAPGDSKVGGYKCFITEHGNRSQIINTKLLIGFYDLDKDEGVTLSDTYEPIHQGSNITAKHNAGAPRIGYKGKVASTTNEEIYNKNCVVFLIDIDENGLELYYGSATAKGMPLSSDSLLDYWGDDIFPEYKIVFDANGGTGTIPSTITKNGADSSVVMGDIGSAVPTKSGYTFKGWSASPNGTSRIAYSGVSGATTTSSSWSYATYCSYTGGDSSNKTLTLYAVWEYAPQYSHTLAYNANGGTNAPSSSTVTNTSSTYSMTVSSSTPTRTGYTFAGWNTNSSGTGTNYSAGGSVSVGANATVTLYAKWTPITYSITYNGNGNTGGSTASQTKAYDAAINLQNNGFTKTGYHFTGWNTASNGAGTSYSAGASYNSNANLALYAQWAINSSTLKVNPNGGTWNNSTVAQTFTQNYNTTKAIPVPTRTGHTFTGWTRSGTNGSMSSLTGSATYTFGASNGVTDTLTAEWKINNYTVTYIDVIDSQSGRELGRSTASKPYNSTVRGSDKGSSVADNAYYNGYYYVSDTSATVTTSGAIVYRIFKQRMNTIAGNIIWEDWNNKNLSRPETVNLYIKGSDGKTYSYVITGNHSQNTSVNRWSYSYDLPKYDSNGKVIVYTVSQDKAISQEKGLSYQEPLINGYDITNKITNMIINTEDYFQIPVTITWDDENDFYGFRPETATLQLLRNGEVIKAADVSDSYTFTELLKYDENGDKYVYTIQASDEKRYTKVENNSAPYNKTVTYTFVNSYFSVLIPKVIVLDGIWGNANYDITVNGAFYYNDTLTVKPATSFVMTDRNNISSMKANILQSKQNFMKEDITSSGAKTTGSIQVDRANFAGSWTGTFKFDIKFVMQN